MRYDTDWSKLKKLLENHFSEKLKNRVQIHLTQYRSTNQGHEPESRFWITVDKKEVFSVSKLKWLKEWYEITQKNSCTYDEAEKVLHEQGNYSIDDIPLFIKEYLSIPFSEALQSNNFIIKSFAMLDKRLGKRRLSDILLVDHEYPLVKELFELRCITEGIRLK